MRIVADFPTGINTNEIGRKLGSSDKLKEELDSLVLGKLLTRERIKNRHYYTLASRGKTEVKAQLQQSFVKDYATLMAIEPQLEQVVSGHLNIMGPIRQVLDDRGIVKEMYRKNRKTGKEERLQ